MPDYYSITVRASFGVLANSQEEAYLLAQQFCPMDDVPARANVDHEAYLTPNQADYIKREAVNQ